MGSPGDHRRLAPALGRFHWRHSAARPQARLRASSTRYGREPGIQSRLLNACRSVGVDGPNGICVPE